VLAYVQSPELHCTSDQKLIQTVQNAPVHLVNKPADMPDQAAEVIDQYVTNDHHRFALQKMGLMTALAIGIHNLPEGLATFVAALADPLNGVAIAIAIALHNIPEGVCVAMPVYYATGSRWKGFMWAFISGLSEPLGGLLGYFVLYGNRMSDLAYGILFCVVGGMMVRPATWPLLQRRCLVFDEHLCVP
jgi:zinc transporter, ZIP family